jgi:hypothetical protein
MSFTGTILRLENTFVGQHIDKTSVACCILKATKGKH